MLGEGVAVCLLLSAHSAVIFAIARLCCFVVGMARSVPGVNKEFRRHRSCAERRTTSTIWSVSHAPCAVASSTLVMSST